MQSGWEPTAPGVLTLPSGRRVRGRGLRLPVPHSPLPEYGLYLVGRDPGPLSWPSRWVRWPDFRLPADAAVAREAIVEAWELSADQRVEVACGGGKGRTGTALACLAVLDGVRGEDAVAYVRSRYNRRAVETPWQRRYVRQFAAR
jgi:hypothetical protein